MNRCYNCKCEVTPDNAYKDSSKKSGLSSECKECHVNRRYLRLYGITRQQAIDLLEHQGGVCGCCQKEVFFTDRRTHVDHCHTTGDVRGIICHHCNTMLGNAKDDPKILARAIEYLKNPPANEVT